MLITLIVVKSMKLKKKPYKILTKSRLKLFLRDFKLPLGATALFFVIVLGLLFTRIYERSILATALSDEINKGQDYASLLDSTNNALTAANESNSTSEINSTTGNAAAATPAIAFTVTPNSPTSTTTGGTTGTDSVPGDNEATPVPVFSSSITEFHQSGNPTQACNGGLVAGIAAANCTRTYSFVATVKTINGPGQVSYRWSSDVQGERNGTFNVSEGETFTQIPNTVTVSCKSPDTFFVEFTVQTPSASSKRVRVEHQC